MVCFGTLLGPEGPGDRCLNLGLPAGAHALGADGAVVAEWDRSSSNDLRPCRYATGQDRLPPVP